MIKIVQKQQMKSQNRNMMIEEEEEESMRHSSENFHRKHESMNSGISQENGYYYPKQGGQNHFNSNSSSSSNQHNLYQYQYDNRQQYFQNTNQNMLSEHADRHNPNEVYNQHRILQKSHSLNNTIGVEDRPQSSDSCNSKTQKFKSFWHIRFSKDYQEILKQNLNDENCLVNVCEPLFFNSHIKLRVLLFPQLGVFSGATIRIYFIVTKDYPYKPVLAFAEEFIYHPNINNNTKQIYWKILDDREWKPTLTLYFIILQLKFAFLEPDLTFVPNNIDNISCAELFQCNQAEFRRKFLIFYQSNDTSTLEKDLSNKMNLEEIQTVQEQDFQTLNQLDHQFNRNTNIGQQLNQNLSTSTYNQMNTTNDAFKIANNFDYTNINKFEPSSLFTNNIFNNNINAFNSNNNTTFSNNNNSAFNNNNNNNNNAAFSKNNNNNISIKPFSQIRFGNSDFMNGNNNNNEGLSKLKQFLNNTKQGNTNFNCRDNNRSYLDEENTNFENHLNIAFKSSNNIQPDYNNYQNLFQNNMEKCSSVKSGSSSASVEHDQQNVQGMEQEKNIFSRLQVLTNPFSPKRGAYVNNETQLTPTLKKDRDESIIRSQFRLDEPFGENCEEVLLSSELNNNQSNYLLIQNPLNSLKEQSLVITSLLDTTSCQMHPKKRKYQQFHTSENANIFEMGKQNKLL